jgi:hypothetical protein
MKRLGERLSTRLPAEVRHRCARIRRWGQFNSPLPRTEVVSKVWEYIKANNLQNPENKREILVDDKLQAVFGGKSKVSMFEMNKYFAQHLS